MDLEGYIQPAGEPIVWEMNFVVTQLSSNILISQLNPCAHNLTFQIAVSVLKFFYNEIRLDTSGVIFTLIEADLPVRLVIGWCEQPRPGAPPLPPESSRLSRFDTMGDNAVSPRVATANLVHDRFGGRYDFGQ